MYDAGNQLLPPIAIRGFQPADLARLHEIDTLCFEQGIAYTRVEMTIYVYDRHSIVRIAERAGNVIGFAIGKVGKRHLAHVITIDVLPQERHIGIGTALLGELHHEFSKAGAVLSVLEVADDNHAAQTFYEKHGYQRGEVLRDYYGLGRDAFRMRCRL